MPDPADAKHQILRDVFGYAEFRHGQAAVIDSLLAGQHTLAVMPTGAGKSLCYQVPALVKGGLAVVISPLIALMQDQVSALELNGVPAVAINSGQDRAANIEAWRRVQRGEVRLVYMAPERLMTERMLAALQRLPLALIAIDEAHCISQWGHSFRAEYLQLAGLRDAFPNVPIAALTATADRLTQDEIVAKIFGGEAARFVAGFDRPNLQLGVLAKQQPKRQLQDFLRRHQGESGIIYCLSRKKVDEIRATLVEAGCEALAYHAGMETAARNAAQARFLRESGLVMVATIAFGMGIDKPDVRFVLHLDIPASLEAYYQEIGRAGRDGAPAEVLMLYGFDDIRMRRMFIDQSEAAEDKKRVEHRRLDALLAFCEAPTCRRRTLLAYFGEPGDEPCGNCDLCLDPLPVVDGTAAAQLVLAAVEATGERFGAGHVIDVLLGKPNDKLTRFGHDRLPEFGSGAGRARPEWQSIIRQMVAAGCLAIDIAAFGSLLVAARGRALLAGTERLDLRLDALQRAEAGKAKASRVPLAPLAAADQGMLGALKALRMSLAKERGVPAYIIFPDRTLHELARQRPTTIEAFGAVHGVGLAKLRDFGARFVATIKDQERSPG